MTGIRRTDNSDEAAELADRDPPVALPRARARLMRDWLQAARKSLAPHSERGSHGTMLAIRKAICTIDLSEAFLAEAMSASESPATPETPATHTVQGD